MERKILVRAAIVGSLFSVAYAIQGKATFYPSSIPAVNDELWDNGRGCGKKFTMKCTGPVDDGSPKARCTGKSVTVKIVDHCFGCPYSFYISPGAFAKIAGPAAEIIKINYAPSRRIM